jgi:CRISPR-associated protein Csb1
MPETSTKQLITPADALKGESPLVLVARLRPVAELDRFQPAGFPEVGHVIYKAPRVEKSNHQERLWEENVCIVDSAASMANHLEAVCLRGAHDYELVDELEGMPYLRCVTGDVDDGKLPVSKREVVVTSLTEGHRIASTYFFGNRPSKTMKWDGKGGQRILDDDRICEKSFGDELAQDGNFGIALDGSKKAHPPTEKWWKVFSTLFRYDPNTLVHGVLFPQWQIKVPRVLTAHLEAFGASRVDRSGVKFDRLGKTTSGQPIFAVDDATAREIRATFILDLALVRSFGRTNGDRTLGLTEKQKEFLVALALWKINRLLASPFRFRSGCHLECVSLMKGENHVDLSVDIKQAIRNAGFADPRITDVYWPRDELYRESKGEEENPAGGDDLDEDEPADVEP